MNSTPRRDSVPDRVWILPIEPFEGRYTEQWLRWYPDGLKSDGWDVNLVMPDGVEVPDVGGGEFLDPVRTWEWKGAQVAALARAWPRIKDGDWILSLDGWGPATTAALYMRDATRKKVRVAGFMDAGCWDPADFLSRRGMGRWGLDIERGWMRGLDLALFGSEFAIRMMWDSLEFKDERPRAVIAIGNPIKAKELRARADPVPWEDRPPIVCFPHRLAPEKDPEAFEMIEDAFRARWGHIPAQFVRSRDVCDTKGDYYRLLGKSRVVVSTAKQETFGIAMQEGIACGAWAVAPDRLSYPDVIRPDSGMLFRPGLGAADRAATMIAGFLESLVGPKWDGYHENAVLRASNAMRAAR